MGVYERCRREATPTLITENGWRIPSWLDYMRIIRASYPWWMRPFVRSRSCVAANAIIDLNMKVCLAKPAPAPEPRR